MSRFPTVSPLPDAIHDGGRNCDVIESCMQAKTAKFLQKVRAASGAVLLVDYDGTLAPFHVDRAQAYPDPDVAALLREIVATGRTRFAVITGRAVKDLTHLLGLLPNPEIWGSHGLERLKRDGTYDLAPIDISAQHMLQQAYSWLVSKGIQLQAETKPGGVAVHWRGLTKERADDIKRAVVQNWLLLAEEPALKLLEFDGGLELRVSRPNKGDAVKGILAELDDNTPVAYLGDDITDEDAFRALLDRGLTGLVRQEFRETSAEVWLRPPEELLEFLAAWLKSCWHS
jgi:trehalose-phosphatase